MKTAAEIYQSGLGIYGWQAWSPEARVELNCTAITTPEGLVFIDPIPLVDSALTPLIDECAPCAILLTNGNHQRASEDFSRRFDIPRCAHNAVRGELVAEQFFDDDASLPGGLRPIALPGGAPGEIALYHAARELLVLGDAIIHLDSTGLVALPAKYCADAKLLAQSLKKLLAFSVQTITFAHGLPIVQSARARLETLLSS